MAQQSIPSNTAVPCIVEQQYYENALLSYTQSLSTIQIHSLTLTATLMTFL